jgi:hypothetical protein
MDYSTFVHVAEGELTEPNILGAIIYGAGDVKVAKVSQFNGFGNNGQVIMDVGGFLGLGAKQVSLTASQLDFVRDAHGNIRGKTSWTKDEVEALPEHRR